MSKKTIADCQGYSLFDKLVALAARVRADTDDDIRSIVEDFVNAPQSVDRVYVKRRTYDPEGEVEALHEEGVFDRSKWQRVQQRVAKKGGVDVGFVFGADRGRVIVPRGGFEMQIVDDPAEVAAIVAMSRTTIATNALERVGTNDADDAAESDAESDVESDVGSDGDAEPNAA